MTGRIHLLPPLPCDHPRRCSEDFVRRHVWIAAQLLAAGQSCDALLDDVAGVLELPWFDCESAGWGRA
jgi:hypothetical protein